MRLYLSSFRFGADPSRLAAMAHDRRASVVANAIDAAPPDVRSAGVARVLRRVLADVSSAQVILVDQLERDAFVYGGYSAGCCPLAPDLAGLQRVDDMRAVSKPITAGLGVLDRPFVPHVDSPGHPETAACDQVAANYSRTGQLHWALRDGEILVIDAAPAEVLRPPEADSR